MNRRELVVSSFAASAAAALPVRALAAAPLRVATSPTDAAAQPYYAQDLGYFHDAGIDPEIVAMANGSVVVSAVVGNAVEIGFANLTSLIVAFKHGIPITVVAPGPYLDSKQPVAPLVVAKNSPIRVASDLNGKTIAVAGLGSIANYAPRLWMDKNGGDSTTAHFVEMNMSQIGGALEAGRIDAGYLIDPYLAEARSQIRVLAQVGDAIASHFTIAAFFANADWARANAATVTRFRSAIARAGTWANTHQDQSAVILAKYGKIPADALKRMIRTRFEDKLDPKDMQPVIDLVARYGGIDATFPAEQLIFKS